MEHDIRADPPLLSKGWNQLVEAINVNWHIVLAFASSTAFFAIGAYFCSRHACSVAPSFTALIWSTLASILASLAASALWLGILIIFYREYLLIVREYSNLANVPLGRHISTASRIEVCVHGWDGLLLGQGGKLRDPLGTSRSKAWKKFFDRGGTLILILPPVPLDDAAADPKTRKRVWQDLKVIARRNERTVNKQIEEIENTIAAARAIAGTNGVVEVRRCKHMRWTCTMKFDDRWLFISLYARRKRDDPFHGPMFRLNLNGYVSTRRWVERLHRRDIACSDNVLE